MESFKHATSRENGTTSPQATQQPASMINFWPISFPPRLLPPEDFEETPRGRDVACFPLKYFQLLFFFPNFFHTLASSEQSEVSSFSYRF